MVAIIFLKGWKSFNQRGEFLSTIVEMEKLLVKITTSRVRFNMPVIFHLTSRTRTPDHKQYLGAKVKE